MGRAWLLCVAAPAIVGAGLALLLPARAMAVAFGDLPVLRYSVGILLCAEPATIRIPPPLGGLVNAGMVLSGRANAECDFIATMDGSTGPASATRDVEAAPVVRSVADMPGLSSNRPTPPTEDPGWQPGPVSHDAQQAATERDLQTSPASVQRRPQAEFAAPPQAAERDTAADPLMLPRAAMLAAAFVLLVLGAWWMKAIVFSERAVLARAAARGLRRNEFSVDYQPIVYLQTRKCVGIKVGVRWKNARHGLQGAGHFMEKLGGSEVAGRIHAHVISKAWEDIDSVPFFTSLYVAVDGWTSCVDDRAKVRRIADLARQFVNTRFVLQVLADTLPEMMDMLLTLRKQGVRVGISGITVDSVPRQVLVDLKPAYLKVHRSVMAMPKNERYHMLHEMARVGRELDIATIANGVESAMQFEVAASAKVEFAQGFFLGRAMLIDQLKEFIEASRNVSVV